MARDPLFTELRTTVREASTAQDDDRLLVSKIAALQRKLSDKYGGAVHVDVPNPPIESEIRFLLSDFNKNRAMSYTLSTVTFADGSWSPEKAQRISNLFLPHPGGDLTPAIYVRVDLSRTTLWDLDRLATDFKEVLRNALAQYRKTGTPSDPSELAFLKTVRKDVFYRDLKRYDLHINHRLPYRLIGFLELHGRTPPDASLSSHRVGKTVSTESSVSDSVRRIYAAIHRVKYRWKSTQPEKRTESERPYHCPNHDRQLCPASCPELKKFEAWFNKTHRPISLITRPYATPKGKAKAHTVNTSLD